MTERRYITFQDTLAGARGEEMDPSMLKDEALKVVAAGSAEDFTEDEMEAYVLESDGAREHADDVSGEAFFRLRRYE